MSRSLFLILVLGLLLAANPPQPATVEIDQLVQQLGSEKFEEREAAAKRLEEIGAPALVPLSRAAESSDDAEIKLRAGRLLKIIGRKLHGAKRVFLGHETKTTYAVFSPDGKRVLSTSDDQSVRRWEVASGKQSDKRDGHQRATLWCLCT